MGTFANDGVGVLEGVTGRPPATFNTAKSELTPKELEVLRLLADGLTTKAVAARLNIAFKTAACHRWRILQKLQVESTVSAVRWAIRVGIVEA